MTCLMIFGYFFLHNSFYIIGFTFMNEQRLSQLNGISELTNENVLLNLAGRVGIVVIESYLPKGYASRMFHSFQSGKRKLSDEPETQGSVEDTHVFVNVIVVHFRMMTLCTGISKKKRELIEVMLTGVHLAWWARSDVCNRSHYLNLNVPKANQY